MDTQEVVETVEAVETVVKNNPALLVGVGLLGASLGVAVGYQVAKRRLEPRYEHHLQQEIKAAQEFYKRVAKEGEFKTPETAVEALVPVEAAEAVRRYQGEDGTTLTEEVQGEVVSETVIERNIFVEGGRNQDALVKDGFDYEYEKANRTETEPYVITVDEFMQNEPEYEQITLTYFAGDDALIDDKDQPLEDADRVVGNENMLRFGHGSRDPKCVYIRNDRLRSDFEIVRSPGKYTEEVLGFIEHSDDRRYKVPKFRRGADE